MDRFPGGPPPCAHHARRVRGAFPLSVQYRLGLLAFGISCYDRRRPEPRGDFARPVLRRVDVLEPLEWDAALQLGPLGVAAVLRGPLPRIEADRFARALPGDGLFRFHRPLHALAPHVVLDPVDRRCCGRGRLSLWPDPPWLVPLLLAAFEAARTHDRGKEDREGESESQAANALRGIAESRIRRCRPSSAPANDG